MSMRTVEMMSRLTKLRAGAAFAVLASSGAIISLAMNLAPVQAQPHSEGPAAHSPNFTGVWARDAHNYPKPYMKGRQIADGYNNEYLKPWVVEALSHDDLVTKSGRAVVTPHSICYPEGIPYVFGGAVMQMLQTPSEVTMLFGDTGQMRTIYMNRPHSAHPVPSWYGESVGHFEGDTLVVDTIGVAVNPQSGSMGNYGTPHTDQLHVIERYRYLADGEKSTAPRPKNDSFDADAVIPGGKTLRLTFTLEDPGAYKKPWSVTLDYLPISSRLREYVCTENAREADLAPLLPQTEVPDF
jgi:hypothetical protein